MTSRERITIWVLVTVVLFCNVAGAAGVRGGQPQASTERNRRFSEIEKDIARSREKIEARYAARIADLQARGDKEIADFERAQRGGLANSAVKTAWFFESMGQVPARGYTQDANGLWLPDKLVAETEKRIADKKEKVLAALEQAVKSLERERDYILKVGLADRERQLKEHALKGGPEAKRGLLCGIAYGRDKRAALLDRIIIHEGEIFYGVKVVEIQRRKVIFEKNGDKWEQKVGGRSDKFWQ